MLSLAHSITIECSDFSSCGNVQFQYVCFENWSISLMQNELFYLSFSHSKKDFYMYLSQVLYWLLMHISEKLCWHSFSLILISWLTMIIICTRLSKVSLRLTNIRKLAQFKMMKIHFIQGKKEYTGICFWSFGQNSTSFHILKL